MTKNTLMGSSRFAINDRILELAENRKDLVFITCDNTADKSPQIKLQKILGERYIDTGIAEQNAVGIACGLALSGKKVIVQTFASFLSLRSIEQIYLDSCYNNAPVIFIGTHSGVTASTAGPTHGALLDYGFLRCMPEMSVIVPSDPVVASQCIDLALSLNKSCYIRVGKGMEPRVYSDKENIKFELGKSIIVREGNDLTFIGCGYGVWACMKAADILKEKNNASARILDMSSLKPIDKKAIIKAAQETSGIITCEDHMITGGLGSSVCEVIAEAGIGIPVIRLGMPDCFYSQGAKPYEIYEKSKYDFMSVYNSALDILKIK